MESSFEPKCIKIQSSKKCHLMNSFIFIWGFVVVARVRQFLVTPGWALRNISMQLV